MGAQSRTAAELAAGIAARAHGIVTLTQLISAGVTWRQIARRLEIGSLIAVHPGVYRVGHLAPSLEADYLAAVLACGDRAVLSGRAAAHLWELVRARPSRPEVTAPTERRVEGVVCHRCRKLETRDRTTHRGIPVLSVPETLVELAASLPQPKLARAFHNASVLYGTTPAEVVVVLDRRPNSTGAGKVRRVLSGSERVTLSQLESRFLSLLRANGLPLPATTPASAAAASTATGPNGAWSSSSTPTASTPRATPGRRIAGASAWSGPAATSFAATPGATWSRRRR